AALVSVGDKAAKNSPSANPQRLFKLFCMGVKTNRDDVVYDFHRKALIERIKIFIDEYNGEVDRYKRTGGKGNVDDFVRYEKIKWSRDLKKDLCRGKYAEYTESKVRVGLYRPFATKSYFFDAILNQDIVRWPTFLPNPQIEKENGVICVPG